VIRLFSTISNKKRKISKAALFILCFWATERFCHKQTDGFKYHNILSALTYHEEWSVPELDQEELFQVKAILKQPFTYLNSGCESYSFVSEDNQFVLKVFKHHHIRFDHPLNRIKLPKPYDYYRCVLLGGCTPPDERLLKLFNSFKIAYEKLKSETGLLFVHLNKTNHLKQSVLLIDKLGISHTYDLDNLEFAIQFKANLFYSELQTLIDKGQIPAAQERLSSLIGLFRSFDAKGLLDLDPILSRNFGFVQGKAIRIDLGGLSTKQHLCHYEKKLELRYQLRSLIGWLDTKSPELSQYIHTQLEQISEK
jgi:hypothetical protein